MEDERTKYNVFLRVKPLDTYCVDDRINSEILMTTDSTITTKRTNKKNEVVRCHYNFKKVFKPSASQAEIFEEVVCPRLHNLWQDSDSLIFSYGSSNSGKSFTIQGTPTDPGIIPRVLHSIFQSIEGHQDNECCMGPYLSCQATILSKEDLVKNQAEKSNMLRTLHDSRTESLNVSLSGTTSEQITMVLEDGSIVPSCLDNDVLCSVWLSFYEIYNENVYDLFAFNPTTLQTPLKLVLDREDDSYHPLNLKVIHAATWDEAYNFYRYGKRNLHVAETLLNRKSSRSHCVFTVKLLTRKFDETDQYLSVRNFILCDLAGSERMKHTDSMGTSIVKEMLNINASLLTLNKCFVLLRSDTQKSSTHEPSVLPYRDSKLTMLFKKFLKGNGHLTMVSNISQETDMLYQTEQVLKMTSLAYNTRVEKKCTERLAFKLPNVMPKRRFSIMRANEQNSPVSGLRSVTPQSSSVEQLRQLKAKNSELEEEIKKKNLMLEALNQSNHQKDLELEAAKKNEAEMRSQITVLEKRLSSQGSNAENFQKKFFEMEEKFRVRVQQASMKELDFHSRLMTEHQRLDDLMNSLKAAFVIPETTGPEATVQQVIYLYQDTIEAATEEVKEYENALETLKSDLKTLQAAVTERDDEIANLKGRILELENSREMEEIRINNKLENSEADDEITTSPCPSDNERLLSSAKIKSLGNAQWFSDEESSPYLPPKSKTTAKKKKKKTKTASDVPYYGSEVKKKAVNSSKTSSNDTVRRARRNLMCNVPDFLGEGSPLNQTIQETQMSPGSFMKRTLRSGKKVF